MIRVINVMVFALITRIFLQDCNVRGHLMPNLVDNLLIGMGNSGIGMLRLLIQSQNFHARWLITIFFLPILYIAISCSLGTSLSLM